MTGDKVRWFEDIDYGAKSWDRTRRVIAKIECASQGLNPRYVVTNLEADAQLLYDELYCARGDMENRIKGSQLDMFGGQTSCQKWWPNQFRLLLSSLAYTLVEAIRRIALKGTELAKAYVGTVRLKLFKIGAVILKNTRRVRQRLPQSGTLLPGCQAARRRIARPSKHKTAYSKTPAG